MDNTHIKKVTAITRVFGEGQKTVAAAVEYDAELRAEDVDKSAFAVEGRRVTDAYVSASAVPERAARGSFVILELDRADAGINTMVARPRPGGGLGCIASIVTPRPVVIQTAPIVTAAGALYLPEAPVAASETKNIVADEFQVFTYHLADGRKVDYNLYIPKNLEPGREYPLVYFIEDAGVLGQDMTITLAQGLGASVWARPEEQAKRPCFVLAPQFHGPESLVQDDFSCTWEVDAAYALIRHIIESYPIDKKRVYGTGQSMGCMTTCELSIRDPELYGGCLLVAGQWDPERIAAAKDCNFWICVSRGDEKAWPGMNALVDALERAGTKVGRAELDALDLPEGDRIVRALAQDGNHVHFTWYRGNSVIPEGVEPTGGAHHTNTWRFVYEMESLREWLFAQHK